ncbi:MAG: hypothetical protein WCA11_13190 [Terracidiphilus sp.]
MLPIVKSGSLRFWGEWLGKPYDNWHVVVSCDATDDCLQIHFNQGEVLAVWNPIDVEIDAKQFRIGSATALRWTWYSYGQSQTPVNLRHMDYAKQDSTDKFPAVEMF